MSHVDTPLASKAFGEGDQTFFARLSGDFNPIHLDPVAARRTQAGQVVVHGVHAVLWALNQLLALGVVTGGIVSLKVRFSKFIYLGRRVDLRVLRRDEASLTAELAVGDLTVTTIALKLGTLSRTDEIAFTNDTAQIPETKQPTIFVRTADLAQMAGWLDAAAPNQIKRHFSHVASAIGAQRTTAIALLSRLVGMICPGLHSLFAAFAVDFTGPSFEHNRLQFWVSETDDRFRIVRMSVIGAGLSGSVQAFLSWPPVLQPALTDIAKLVSPGEFANAPF